MVIITASRISLFLLGSLVSSVYFADAALKGKFIIFGDIHYDPSYTDSGTSCNEFVPRSQRLTYGNYECDSSLRLTQSVSQKVHDESQNTDFIVFAGDMVQHARNKDDLNENKALNIIREASEVVRRMIDSSVPIIPVMGNHDFYPASQVSPERNNQFMSKLTDIFARTFSLGPTERDSFRRGGYYSRSLSGKLLLLVLNTNFYKPSNEQTDPDTQPDPAGQFAWMRLMLSDARNDGFRVFIFAHIPPGISETQDLYMFKDEYNKKFNQIILDYSDVISGIQAAHTHTDSFRIYYKGGLPVVPLHIGPSVTPWRRPPPGFPPRNPAVRTVLFDTSGRMDFTDYIQHFMKLEDANRGNAVWKTEYSFTQAYGTPDASARSLDRVYRNFVRGSLGTSRSDSQFPAYFLRNSVDIANSDDKPSIGVYTCDNACKAVHLCSIINLDYDDYEVCKIMSSNSNVWVSSGNRMKIVPWLLAVSIILCFFTA